MFEMSHKVEIKFPGTQETFDAVFPHYVMKYIQFIAGGFFFPPCTQIFAFSPILIKATCDLFSA